MEKCKRCWNFKECENKHRTDITICFKFRKSICYYCIKRNDCKYKTDGMGICTEYIYDTFFENQSE